MLLPIQIHCNLICGKKGLNVGGKALNIYTAFQASYYAAMLQNKFHIVLPQL